MAILTLNDQILEDPDPGIEIPDMEWRAVDVLSERMLDPPNEFRLQETGCCIDGKENMTPFDFFLHYFGNDEFFEQVLVVETNRYAAQKHIPQWVDVTHDEMVLFIFLIVKFSSSRTPFFFFW